MTAACFGKAVRQYEVATSHVIRMNRLCCACTLDPCGRLASVSDVVGTDQSMHEMKAIPVERHRPAGCVTLHTGNEPGTKLAF